MLKYYMFNDQFVDKQKHLLDRDLTSVVVTKIEEKRDIGNTHHICIHPTYIQYSLFLALFDTNLRH
jgi:hypothetical protein